MHTFCTLFIMPSFHVAIFCSYCTHIILHSFQVEPFLYCTFFMLHFFPATFYSCYTHSMFHFSHTAIFFFIAFFHVVFFNQVVSFSSQCTFFLLHFFHVKFFHVDLILCCTCLILKFSMLDCFQVALLNCSILDGFYLYSLVEVTLQISIVNYIKILTVWIKLKLN